MQQYLEHAAGWLTDPGWAPARRVAAAAGAVLAALLLHRFVFAILRRAGGRGGEGSDRVILGSLEQPSRWLLVALALIAVQPALALDREARAAWRQVAGLVMPGVIGWLVVGLLRAGKALVEAHADITVADNLRARRRRTRASILYRIAVFLVMLVTFCLMLMSIPSVRSIGVTLIASAGLAALAVGAAAQPALKNLIGGLQMAFTEPIRLDDVVVIDGEWGRIEEIRLTFVAVKLWDERRLIVPVSRFLDQPFQNWTRETSALLGSVLWQFDPAADVARLRAELERIVHANPRWDGRSFGLQVTNMAADAIEVRALVTAADASTAFDLRCDVREAMLAFVRAEMPEALPRRRGDVSVQPAAAPTSGSTG